MDRHDCLGKIGLDVLTDINGTVTGYFQTLHGNDQFQLTTNQAYSNEGNLIPSQVLWVECSRIKIL